ncbi:hypothetical protein H310_15108 [Aphanomyces invadans]|uniref:Uncharacterized protein n=1 Tax=Aphanomyces invadans TaxID=157072 RepID=A0A024T9P8_9STRA|nr:hypothetical protein H310_15108 [Aphanomyces invadans]ETV90062.1 hypothetical protein H310_15108 [Aphanomyces invadans]|eukprot:XP_008881307.1 hypothetical protein H310_15108 [Aphanomyces invadans]
MAMPSKRRNFSDEDDIMLLRQVSLEMPFEARRGLVVERWNAVASALRESDEFSRLEIDAKRACNQIMLLLDAHRKHDKESALAPGVDEDENEKIVLLDDLLAAYDDAKRADLRRADESREAANHAEMMGSLVRAEAMEPLDQRKRKKDDDDASSGGGKFMKIIALMQEQVKADLDSKRKIREGA